MELLFQQLTNGLAVGGIYALIALGYTMVHGVLKLINFAQIILLTQARYLAYHAAGIPRALSHPRLPALCPSVS